MCGSPPNVPACAEHRSENGEPPQTNAHCRTRQGRQGGNGGASPGAGVPQASPNKGDSSSDHATKRPTADALQDLQVAQHQASNQPPTAVDVSSGTANAKGKRGRSTETCTGEARRSAACKDAPVHWAWANARRGNSEMARANPEATDPKPRVMAESEADVRARHVPAVHLACSSLGTALSLRRDGCGAKRTAQHIEVGSKKQRAPESPQ